MTMMMMMIMMKMMMMITGVIIVIITMYICKGVGTKSQKTLKFFNPFIFLSQTGSGEKYIKKMKKNDNN